MYFFIYTRRGQGTSKGLGTLVAKIRSTEQKLLLASCAVTLGKEGSDQSP